MGISLRLMPIFIFSFLHTFRTSAAFVIALFTFYKNDTLVTIPYCSHKKRKQQKSPVIIWASCMLFTLLAKWYTRMARHPCRSPRKERPGRGLPLRDTAFAANGERPGGRPAGRSFRRRHTRLRKSRRGLPCDRGTGRAGP